MPASEEFIRAVFIGKRFADMKDYEAAFRQFRFGYSAAIAMVSVIGAILASVVAVRLLRSDT